MKKKLWLVAVIISIMLGLCACGKEPANVEEPADMGPYREWIRTGSVQEVTVSIKVPEKWLVYEDVLVSELSDQVINTSLYVNDGADPELKEVLAISLYEKRGICVSNQTEFEYVTDSQKDHYDFELVEEKEEGNIRMLFIEGVDKDFESDSMSNKMRMAAGFVTVDDNVFCCQVSCNYRYKEQEEVASFEEFEKIVESVVFEMLPYGATQSGGETQSDGEAKGVQESVSADVSTDWRSGGFFVNGQYAQVPMTVEELADMGFDRYIEWDMERSEYVEVEERAMEPFTVWIARATNEAGEYVYATFVNYGEQVQDFKECTVYEVKFGVENSLSDEGVTDVALCNGLTIGDSYEEIVKVMGTPDKEFNATPGDKFSGSMTYYYTQDSKLQYVEMMLYQDVLSNIDVHFWPEDFYDKQLEYGRQQSMQNTEETQSADGSQSESTSESEVSGNSQVDTQTEGVEVYEPLDYPQDDWRSGGMYYNGTYFQLPMSYQELCDLGFGRLGQNGVENIDNLSEESKKNYMIPAYSCNLALNLIAYNEEGKYLDVSFVNETGEEQWIKDCTIYEIQFTDDVMEENLGDSIKLCNGVTHMTTYEEVIELMGEPDHKYDASDENGFSGSIVYQLDGGNRRVTIHFFKNQVDGFTVTMMPIDAHILTRVGEAK